MGWRGGIKGRMAQLERQRLRLEQVRLRATRKGSDATDGERLEARTLARLADIEQRTKDVRASLE
jgi:hypothetical protein